MYNDDNISSEPSDNEKNIYKKIFFLLIKRERYKKQYFMIILKQIILK